MNFHEPNRQDFKSKLLHQAGLGDQVVVDFGNRVHMVKLWSGPRRRHRLVMHDGGWIEIDPESRKIVLWGPRGLADDLVKHLVDVEDYSARRLEKSGTSHSSNALRRRPRPLEDAEVKTLAERWRQLGFDDIHEDESGCWVTLTDGTRFHDTGGHVAVHGPITDAAIVALVAHTKLAWGGRHRLTGPWTPEQVERVWLEGMRQGVELCDYTPSPALVARWEAEQAASSGAGTALRPRSAPAAQPMPTASTTPTVQDADRSELASPADRRAEQIAEIDREIALLERKWTTDARTKDTWIEDARRNLEELEERRRQLLRQSRQGDVPDAHKSEYRGPR